MVKKYSSLIGVCSLVLLAWIVTVVGLSWNALRSVQLQDWSRAERSSFWARQLFQPIDFGLGWISGDVRTWAVTLRMIERGAQLVQLSREYLPHALAGAETARTQAPQVRQLTQLLTDDLSLWLQAYDRSHVLPQFMNANSEQITLQSILTEPERLHRQVSELSDLVDELLQGKHRYIVLLQNSDELRGTGGFMGSYALIELQDGTATTFEVQDIYVPDGQYQGYTEPPAGVREYLSAGKGLRLPDANWSPDFPSAAQEISTFFEYGGVDDIEGVIALNLSVAEDALRVLGPVHLPDYKQTITPDNLSILARLDRDEFFPGSQQKRQFLQALLTQLKLSVTELSPDQVHALSRVLQKAAVQKNIQGFSHNSHVQSVFTRYAVTGDVSTRLASRYLYLVESNVGINKANRLVTRKATLTLHASSTQVTVQFENKNPETNLQAERGEYINYQRVLVPASYRVRTVVVNGQELPAWDEQLITTHQGESLKQLGFLVTVPASSGGEFSVELTHADLPFTSLTLQKQSGLAPMLYQINTPAVTQTLLLETDTTLPLDATIGLDNVQL